MLSLELLYDDPSGRILFKKFLKKTKNTESLMFLEAVEEFARLKSSHNRYLKLTVIVDKFIKVNAKYELNLSQPCRSKLIQRVKNECSPLSCPHDLFDECVTHVMMDLKEDVWSRFIRTPEFLNFMSDWQAANGSFWTTGQEMMTICGFDVSTPFFKDEDFERVEEWVKGEFIEDEPWKLTVKKKEYSVYLSEKGIKADSYTDRAVKSWKIEGTVDIPLEVLAKILISTPLRIQTDGNLKTVTALDFLTAPDSKYACSITHEVYDMGRLVTDRDYVLSQSFRSEETKDGLKRLILIRKTVDHEMAPKSTKKPIRADAIACFYLEEINATRSRYYEVGWIDLKGNLPLWLWEALIKMRGGVFHKGLKRRYKIWKAAEKEGKLEALGYTDSAGMFETLLYYETHCNKLQVPSIPPSPSSPIVSKAKILKSQFMDFKKGTTSLAEIQPVNLSLPIAVEVDDKNKCEISESIDISA